MQISISIEELTQLQNSISHKDVEIAMLRKEVEQLRKQPVIQGGTENDAFIIPLRLENVCKVFRLLKGNSAFSCPAENGAGRGIGRDDEVYCRCCIVGKLSHEYYCSGRRACGRELQRHP